MAHGWRSGTIIALSYKEDRWPLGQVAPYQVALADGSLICVPEDIDQFCREISQLTTEMYEDMWPAHNGCGQLTTEISQLTPATTTATCQFRSSNLSVYHSVQLDHIPEAAAAQTGIPGAQPPQQ